MITGSSFLEMPFFWEPGFCLFLIMVLIAGFELDLAIKPVSREKVTFTVLSIVNGMRLMENLAFTIFDALRGRGPPLMLTTE